MKQPIYLKFQAGHKILSFKRQLNRFKYIGTYMRPIQDTIIREDKITNNGRRTKNNLVR